jgi:proline dehydrogenase
MQATTKINFGDTAIAFEAKSDKSLKKAAWLFGLMNNPRLVKVGSSLGLLALKLRLPVEGLVEKTIFEQFCGGRSLLHSKKTIDALAKFDVQTILDYGAEGKASEEDFNSTMREIMEAIRFAGRNAAVPFVSTKITGLGRFTILEKAQAKISFTAAEQTEYDNMLKRLDALCSMAREHHVGLFIDAEESWIQNTIDDLANLMMARYNQAAPTVYNTFQLYRHDRLAYLKQSLQMAERGGYLLGAKLVRGAYMDKERARAATLGYLSPIQPDKAATDRDYNLAVEFCIAHHERIASCTATHNAESCQKQVERIETAKLERDNAHFLFSQLYGMSDNLTFNLQKAGFNTAKYIPYGPVKEVIPYLIRRAEENTSVTGDMGRELALIKQEIKRRGI